MAEVLATIGTLSQRVQSTSNGVGGIVVEHQHVPIDASGNVNSELPLGAQPSFATTMDWPAVSCGFLRTKTVYIVVTTLFSWTGSGNVTAQLYVGRTAGSVSDTTHPLVGTATNLLSAGGTSLATGAYVLTPNGVYTGAGYIATSSNFAELAQYHPYVGVRLVFPGVPSAGAAAIYVEASPA